MRRSFALLASLVVVAAFVAPAAAGPHDSHESKHCNPTLEQEREARAFARETIAATGKYEDPLVALQDDFIPWVDTWKPIFHLVKYEHYYDWKILDPQRPEALTYAKTNSGPKLIGIMYSMEDPGREPPDFGGCILRWHTHPQCRSPFGYSHIWEEDWGGCPPGWEDDGGSELMLHVWTVPMRDGPYSYHPDPAWECWPTC